MIVKSFTVNPFAENTYIVHDEETLACMIIDPGCHNKVEENILSKYITENNLKPEILVNTHCHIDHIMGNGYINKTYHLPLYMHQGEEETMTFSSLWGKSYGLDIGDQPVERIYINEGQQLKLGKYTIDILFTPGHSIASISLYCKERNILFSGDVLFRQGIGRYDLPGGDFEILEQSIKQKLYTLPDATEVYSGHGATTTIGFEKVNNPYVNY